MRTTFTRVLLVVLAAVLVVYAMKHTSGDEEALVALRDLDPESLAHGAFVLESDARLVIDGGGSFESGEADSVWAAYGWIVNRESGEPVWVMTGTRPRRGSFRAVSDSLWLPAGTYDAYFSSYGDPSARSADKPNASLVERLRDLLSREGRGWYGDADRWRFVVHVVEGEGSDVAHSLDREPEKALRENSTTVWASGPLRNREKNEELLLVSRLSDVVVRATGEIEDGVVVDGARLVRVMDGTIVWQLSEENTTWAGGDKRNRQARDTLRLAPGVYRAVASTDEKHAYGEWNAHPPRQPHLWGMSIDRADDSTQVHVLDPFSESLDLPTIVSFDCVGSDSTATATFQLRTQMAVLVKAVGEITDRNRYDYATLDKVVPGGSESRVWEMHSDNAEHAGGASKNRRVREVLALAPGRYRLSFQTDGSHDCADYNARPPEPSDFWGAAIYALDPSTGEEADSTFWTVVEPIANTSDDRRVLFDMTGVGSNQNLSNLLMTTPVTLHIVAVGEFDGSRGVDYGWIENSAGERVWEMRSDNTEPGGGDPRNRFFEGSVDLPAGTYTFRFVSNDAHDAEGFEGEPPSVPAGWGMLITQ